VLNLIARIERKKKQEKKKKKHKHKPPKPKRVGRRLNIHGSSEGTKLYIPIGREKN